MLPKIICFGVTTDGGLTINNVALKGAFTVKGELKAQPAKADPYADLKAALAAGKTIQFEHPTRGASVDCKCEPSFILPPKRYRVKPEQAQPNQAAIAAINATLATPDANIDADIQVIESALGDGWIKWSGGECPVDPDTIVYVQTRGGGYGFSQAKLLEWRHYGLPFDIVEYRVKGCWEDAPAEPDEELPSSTSATPATDAIATLAEACASDDPLTRQVGGSHYRECAIQPVEFIEANRLGFLEGCVVKRLTRHDKPTGKGRQDIEKAIHELQILLAKRYPDAGGAQ